MLEHKHLIVRAEVSRPPKDEILAIAWMVRLIQDIGMKALIGPIAKYLEVTGNRGLTVVCIIETSHIVLHSWDEASPGLIQLDVYTCGSLDPNVVFNSLADFEPIKIEYKFLDREHNLQEI